MKHTGNKYRKKIKNNRIKSISVLADLLSDHPDNSLAIIIILLMCTQHIPAGGYSILTSVGFGASTTTKLHHTKYSTDVIT